MELQGSWSDSYIGLTIGPVFFQFYRRWKRPALYISVAANEEYSWCWRSIHPLELTYEVDEDYPAGEDGPEPYQTVYKLGMFWDRKTLRNPVTLWRYRDVSFHYLGLQVARNYDHSNYCDPDECPGQDDDWSCDGGQECDFIRLISPLPDFLVRIINFPYHARWDFRRWRERMADRWEEFRRNHLSTKEKNLCQECRKLVKDDDGHHWSGLGDQTMPNSEGIHRIKIVKETKAGYNCTHYWHYEARCGKTGAIFIDSGD
jgi:hypothetical protein